MMRKIALSIICLLILPCASFALQSGPFMTTTPISLALTDLTGALTFAKFDSSLGNLTGVQIDLSGYMTTSLTVTNCSLQSSSGTAKTELQLTVQDAGSNLIAPTIDIFSSSFNYNLGAGESATSGTLTKSGSSSDLYTSAAILSAFTGTGSIALTAFSFTQTWLTNTGGNTSASQITQASLNGCITYFYDVPEPATMALLTLGGFVFRKRSRK